MEFMIWVEPYYSILPLFIYYMNSEGLADFIMIDLHVFIAIIFIWFSGILLIYLLNR